MSQNRLHGEERDNHIQGKPIKPWTDQASSWTDYLSLYSELRNQNDITFLFGLQVRFLQLQQQ